MKQFEVGKRYFARSITDHTCVWTFEVISRTEKTVKLLDVDGFYPPKSRRISVDKSGEYVLPLGSYAFAPVLRAERVAGGLEA